MTAMTFEQKKQLIEKYDLSTTKGKKELAIELDRHNFLNGGWIQYECEDILADLGVSGYRIECYWWLARSAKKMVELFGAEVANEFIEIYDKCLDLFTRKSINLGTLGESTLNTYAMEFDNEHPCLFSISLPDTRYDSYLELRNRYNYRPKYLYLFDTNVSFVKMVTRVLKEEYVKEIEYRKQNAWKGEIDLEILAEQLQTLFPKLQIYASVGKRQSDGNCKPYKAIVVRTEKYQLGTMTLSIDRRGIGCLSTRVPLCGESSCEVTNDNIISSLKESVEFMLD